MPPPTPSEELGICQSNHWSRPMPLPPQVSHSFRDREQGTPSPRSTEHTGSLPQQCTAPARPALPPWTGRKQCTFSCSLFICLERQKRCKSVSRNIYIYIFLTDFGIPWGGVGVAWAFPGGEETGSLGTPCSLSCLSPHPEQLVEGMGFVWGEGAGMFHGESGFSPLPQQVPEGGRG